MYVVMNKLIENDTCVEYEIETRIWGEIFINEKGNRDSRIKTIFAYCKFNKKNEEFSLDINKTDPYFLEPNSREIRHAMVKLILRSRENKPFEQLIEIVTGG